MEKQNHFYIISYDLDNQADSTKSKRLLEFLRKYQAICLTKSTWLLCTSSDSFTVFTHVSRIIESASEFSQIFFSGSADRDRLFVAEITGKVFGEYLVCNEKNSELTLDKLMEISGSTLIEDGFKAIYGS